VVFGAGGHAVSVAGVLQRNGYEIEAFIDEKKRKPTIFGIPVLETMNELKKRSTIFCVIAVGNNFQREKLVDALISRFENLKFPKIVDKSAVICPKAEVGEGAVLMPGTVLGVQSSVGSFCIMNTSSSLDHESTMSDFSSLGPGANVAGKVAIGARTAIMMNSSVAQNVVVGEDCVVGANSFVATDVPRNSLSMGVPSKVVRIRLKEENYY